MAEVEIRGQQVLQERVHASARLPSGGNIPEEGRPPFIAVHHHDWEFLQEGPSVALGGEWFACVTECPFNAGSNGVGISGVGKDARLNTANFMQGIRSKRSVPIEQHDPRLGEFADYMSSYVLDTGKKFYTYAWLKYVLVNNGRNAVPRLDKAKMLGFRRKIVESRIVDPMPRTALDTQLVRLEQQISRWSELRDNGRLQDDAFQKRRAENIALAKAMSAAFDRQFGEAPALPVVDSEGTEILVDDPMAIDADDLPNPGGRAGRKRG
jgi:hypothetical protein